jgi:hypothetical protein
VGRTPVAPKIKLELSVSVLFVGLSITPRRPSRSTLLNSDSWLQFAGLWRITTQAATGPTWHDFDLVRIQVAK